MNDPIIFVTLDPLRGLGIEKRYDNFHLVCFDYTPVVDMLMSEGISVFCLEKEAPEISLPHSTRHLLTHPLVQEYILGNSTRIVNIAVFKPTFSIPHVLGKTSLGTTRQVYSLNADVKITKKLENKLHFFNLCLRNNLPHTPAQVQHLHTLEFEEQSKKLGTPFVIQFETGWFGNRTFFIHEQESLKKLQKQYSNRQVLIAPFIKGPVLTNNIMVGNTHTYQSYPFMQLNDTAESMPKLSRLPGSTIGNVWGSLDGILGKYTNTVVQTIYTYTEQLGSILRDMGFRGYAGLDFLISEAGEVFLQELNPRFTASVQMITQLEEEAIGSSLLDLHFRTFGINLLQDTVYETDEYFLQLSGCRVIARNTHDAAMQLADTMSSGVYTVQKDNSVTFDHPGYQTTLLAPDQCHIFFADSKRNINPDEEIFQIQSTSLPPQKVEELARSIKSGILFSETLS